MNSANLLKKSTAQNTIRWRMSHWELKVKCDHTTKWTMLKSESSLKTETHKFRLEYGARNWSPVPCQKTRPSKKKTGQLVDFGEPKVIPFITGAIGMIYSIVNIGQNTEKGPGELSRLAVTQTQMKDYQLTLSWKNCKE